MSITQKFCENTIFQGSLIVAGRNNERDTIVNEPDPRHKIFREETGCVKIWNICYGHSTKSIRAEKKD